MGGVTREGETKEKHALELQVARFDVPFHEMPFGGISTDVRVLPGLAPMPDAAELRLVLRALHEHGMVLPRVFVAWWRWWECGLRLQLRLREGRMESPLEEEGLRG